MILGSFPLTRRCRGDACDCLRETEDRPNHYHSIVHQLTSKRVQPPSWRMLTKDREALDREREHRPRTHDVRLAATRQPSALFIKDCARAGPIAGVGHLAKKRSDAHSLGRGLRFKPAGGFGMVQGARPVTAKEIDQT